MDSVFVYVLSKVVSKIITTVIVTTVIKVDEHHIFDALIDVEDVPTLENRERVLVNVFIQDFAS